jgi:hypothetical protein
MQRSRVQSALPPPDQGRIDLDQPMSPLMVSGRTKAHELERLLPWAWKAERLTAAVDA